MVMRKIPNTEIEVSAVCFGTMNFGVPVGREEAAELINHAFDKGINFIDTANMYEGYARYAGSHGGVAEQIIADAVKGKRHDFILATKFGMKVGEAPEDEGCSPAALEKQLDRSLKYLGTDYIDVYYAHKFDPAVPASELCAAMKRAMDAGKIRCWAVSNYNGAQLCELLGAADANSLPRPVLYQPPLSLLKQDALTDGVAICQRENIGVVPYQILQGGLLSGKYRRGERPPKGSRAGDSQWLELDDKTFDELEAIGDKAEEENLTLLEYATRWVMTRPAVVSALVGFRSKGHIDQAAAIAAALCG